MATAAEYEQQLNNIRGQMDQYTPVNLGDLTKDFMSKVDFFKPQYEEQRGIQAGAQSYLPKFMNDFYTKYGPGGGAGPGAFNMLSYGLGDVNRQMGTANAVGDVINRAGGRIEDLAKNTLDQYMAAKQSLMDKYNLTMPLFQAQQQAEEAARARAAQQALVASMYGGAGGDGGAGQQDMIIDTGTQNPGGAGNSVKQIGMSLEAIPGTISSLMNAERTQMQNRGLASKIGIRTLESLNANRVGAGMAPMSQSEYQNTYLPNMQGALNNYRAAGLRR